MLKFEIYLKPFSLYYVYTKTLMESLGADPQLAMSGDWGSEYIINI